MRRSVFREQIVMVSPGVEIGPVPVFSDLVSLQYVRPEVGGDILFGNSDLSDIDEADPDNYLNRATDAFVDVTVDKVGTRFPGFTGAAIAGSYAGCYDVTPDWNPVISKTALDGLLWPPVSAATGSRSPRPSVGGRRPGRRRPQQRPTHPTHRFSALSVHRRRSVEEPISVRRCRQTR